ncbi:MAG TPA: ribosomal-protein-alanine N-acetyltransferase [Caldithrix abyssi]|uniref:[Ribosomal protein bS18]-alanine N-acetyltransferase n=1 Tax=Caldithrix abyssi TaxID=187145 RepID=A0A7V5H1Z7_CALAY|nr:ribosomal protein S18-alanine N-acetyltransferase [Caldisericaceae bacterium]HHE54202.1 ribosomal-protein-alanine N-acetyltransferase [Caldithrix abyssi]
MKVKIRPMTLDDVGTVVRLEQQIFIDAWSKESFLSEILQKDYSHPLILEVEDQLAGYAIVWRYYDELHIANFAIHPDFRQRGLGKLLMRHILQEFGDATFAFLEVRKSNTAAINLYQAFGFRIIQVRKNYYRDGEDALVMLKDLRNSNI